MKILALIFILAVTAQAQTLSGIVKDPQGAAVKDAAVSVISRSSSASWSTTSDAAGAYRFESIPDGDYLLRAQVAGFADFLARVQITARQSLDIALQLAVVHNEIVVTASSTPQTPQEVSKATTVIDHSETDCRDAASLADTVSLAPSVRVAQLGGPGALVTIQIRGLRSQDTAVLVDGLRLRDASATQADASGMLEDLLVTDTNRVEILRGTGSTLYGTNAIGGVINVITDEGGGRTRGSLLLEGGSLGEFRGRAQVSGGWLHDRVQYSLGATQLYVESGVGGDNPFRETSVQGRATIHFSPATRLVVRLYAGDSFGKLWTGPEVIGNPSGFGVVNAVPNVTFLPAPDDPDSTRAARYITGALILTSHLSPALDVSLSYQVESNGRRYDNGPAGVGYQPAGSTRSLYDGRIQTVNAHADYRAGKHNLLTGGYEFESENYANDNVDATNPAAASAVQVTQLSHALFVQDQVRLFGDRLQLSGAFRVQFFSLDTPAFLPQAAQPYQGTAFGSPAPAYTGDGSAAYFFHKTGTKLRAHVGRGYRAPSLFERFGAGYDSVYGYTVYGDPRLQPEHSLGTDAGIDQMFWYDRVKASVSYFYTTLQNVIAFDTAGVINAATDPYGRFIGYINSRGGISRGVEVSAAISATRSLNITVAYTFLNAIERVPLVGDTLQTFVVPRHQFSVLATQRVGARTLLTMDTRASSNYLSPVYGDFITQVYRFNGMKNVNAGASYRIPRNDIQAIRLFVRGENLLGQRYTESGFPAPGRTAMAGLQFEF